MQIVDILNEALNWKKSACYIWPRQFSGARPTVHWDYIPGYPKKSPVQAHRAIYMIAYNQPNLATHQLVLHTCGNGHNGCIAINHLKLGTTEENWEDWRRHGGRRGKLTAEIVADLRAQDDGSNRYRRESAERLGMSYTAISDALSGRSWGRIEWRHAAIPGAVTQDPPRHGNCRPR